MNTPVPPDAVAVASLPVFAIVASPSNPRKRLPALPANEPAAPVKTSTPDLLPAWPFPRSART